MCTPSFAQMAAPSIFSEMKSVNPAILTMRKSGVSQASAQVDSITKDQQIEKLDATTFSANVNSKIQMLDLNAYRGGRGGGYTTEFVIDSTFGKKISSIVDSLNSNSTNTEKASSSYLSFSIGSPSKTGLNLFYVNYKNEYIYQSTVNGQNYNSNFSGKATLMGAKPGIVFGDNNQSIGLTFQFSKLDNTNSSPTTQKQLGGAIGLGAGNLHFELGVEFDPFTKRNTIYNSDGTLVKSPMTLKLSLLAETKIAGFTLGYKGMAYRGQYTDFDRLIQSQMIFSNLGSDTRIEHTFNFTLGGASGLGIGGSASYSNSNTPEKSNLFSSNNTHPTQTKAISLSGKIYNTF